MHSQRALRLCVRFRLFQPALSPIITTRACEGSPLRSLAIRYENTETHRALRNNLITYIHSELCAFASNSPLFQPTLSPIITTRACEGSPLRSLAIRYENTETHRVLRNNLTTCIHSELCAFA